MPARVRIPAHVVARDFGTETVVLNLRSRHYHGLNSTAGRMFELLGEAGDVGAAARRFVDESGAPEARVTADLEELCSALEDRGLIEVERAG